GDIQPPFAMDQWLRTFVLPMLGQDKTPPTPRHAAGWLRASEPEPAHVFDERFQPGRGLTQPGLNSRARVSLGTGGHAYLVEGDVGAHSARVIRDEVECPRPVARWHARRLQAPPPRPAAQVAVARAGPSHNGGHGAVGGPQCRRPG